MESRNLYFTQAIVGKPRRLVLGVPCAAQAEPAWTPPRTGGWKEALRARKIPLAVASAAVAASGLLLALKAPAPLPAPVLRTQVSSPTLPLLPAPAAQAQAPAPSAIAVESVPFSQALPRAGKANDSK